MLMLAAFPMVCTVSCDNNDGPDGGNTTGKYVDYSKGRIIPGQWRLTGMGFPFQ